MNTKTIFHSNIGKLLLIISIILYIISSLYTGVFVNYESSNGLFRLEHAVLFNYPILAACIGFIIIIFCGIYWASLSKKYKLFEGDKSTLFTLIAIGIGLWPSILIHLEILFAAALILSQIGFFLTIYNQKNINSIVFNGALFLGFATLIYLPAIYFFVVFLIGVSIIRPFNLKTYLIGLLGLILPILYAYSIAYLLDFNLLSIGEASSSIFSNQFQWQELNTWKLGYLILFLIGFIANLLRKTKLTVHVSNQIAYFSLLFLVSFSLFFINDERVLVLLLIPASLFIGNLYNYFNKKWILDLGLLLFLNAFSVIKWIG